MAGELWRPAKTTPDVWFLRERSVLWVASSVRCGRISSGRLVETQAQRKVGVSLLFDTRACSGWAGLFALSTRFEQGGVDGWFVTRIAP